MTAAQCTGAWAKRPRRSAAGTEPAVEVDQPGCSYNPDAAQHQDAVAVAVAAEVSKGLAAQLAPQAPPLLAGDAGAAEQDELGLLQVCWLPARAHHELEARMCKARNREAMGPGQGALLWAVAT